jgi:hypothetical protein
MCYNYEAEVVLYRVYFYVVSCSELMLLHMLVGWDSVVGIAACSGWMARGSNPGGGEIFSTCTD